MELDLVLPIVLFAFLSGMVFLYPMLEPRLKRLLEGDTKLRNRDVLLLVLIMTLMITIFALIPSRIVQIVYVSLFSYSLFSFTFLTLKKRFIAVLPPLLFILSYLLFWNLLTFNIFAFILASIIILYSVNLFSWKTTLIFAALLTIVDVVQVFITGLMGQLAEKAVFELSLPIVIIIPTYPTIGRIILGLGDIFLSGLLSLQNMLKKGRTSGILTALLIGIAMLLFEVANFNTNYFTFFPATIIVLLGWLAGTGIAELLAKGKQNRLPSTS
ncbi:MAG: hypothetical protein V1915_00395 [Candidatus Bathyarchaeota archaeon]